MNNLHQKQNEHGPKASLSPSRSSRNPTVFKRKKHVQTIRTIDEVVNEMILTYKELSQNGLIDVKTLAKQLNAVERWRAKYNVFELESLLLDILEKYGQISKSSYSTRSCKLRKLYNDVCKT